MQMMPGPFETRRKNLLFAELFGIMLGDGNIYVNKRHHVYQVRVASHFEEKDYRAYVSSIFEELFEVSPAIFFGTCGAYVAISKRAIAERLMMEGLTPRTRDKNIVIPLWIRENQEYLKVFIRGLIDTDGCVFRLSKKDPNILRISYKSANVSLSNVYREGLLKLGYHPSKVIYRNVFLTRKADTQRYIQEIGFRNTKHLRRLESIKRSPVV